MNINNLIESLRFKNKSEIIDYASQIKKKLPPDYNLSELLNFSSLSPDPDLSIRTFSKILNSIVLTPVILKNLKELLWILGASEYLGKILLKYPDLLSLFEGSQKTKNYSQFLEELITQCSGEKEIEGIMSRLRKYREREYFRIGVMDLLKKADLVQVTAELSSLASAALEVALRFSDGYLKKAEIRLDKESNSGFVVIGMGKLGGNELNFLSDIDLIYISTESVSIEYSTKLANTLTKIISDVTADGFVFRLDLRLRPDGEAGQVVNSLPATIDYYTQWGETWERSALIKANPVAGDMALGMNFLQGVEPFVYRKYLDYTTIEELKELKRRIESNMNKKLSGSWNIKTGTGGIRSIEFFVQTLQLINGGKMKSIRKANTLSAIDSLSMEKLITPGDAKKLKDAYIFLREVEHRIQISEGQRTHSLPEGEELIHLARRTLFEGSDNDVRENFLSTLSRYRDFVNDLFSSLFYKEEEKEVILAPYVEQLMAGEIDKDSIVNQLKKQGFENAEKTFEILNELKDEPIKKRFSSRAKQIFKKLLPIMINEVSLSSDPDSAIHFLSEFLKRVGGRIVPYYQLAENRETLRYLISLFSNSEYLSNFLINHPELLDYLILKEYAAPVKSKENIASELDRLLKESSDYESQMNILRRFRNTEILRIASNDLYGEITLEDVSRQFTALAEIMLDRCLRIAMDNLADKFGNPGDSKIAVLGLGKLGGKELGYNSDLDTIFVYSDDGMTENGRRSITLREYFTYVAQRVISLLSTYTADGYVFKVDTRLRPSGNAGAMVTSLDALKKYHEESAWLWERQAMIKLRSVAGDKGFGKLIENIIKKIIFSRGLTDKEKHEMDEMKQRIISEHTQGKNKHNLKYSSGGLIELEFLIQGYQMEYGKDIEELQTPEIVPAIKTLSSKGIITEKNGEILLKSHSFLRKLENRLRLLYDYSHDNLPESEKDLLKLARGVGLGDKADATENLIEMFLHWTKKINLLYNNYFRKNGTSENTNS
jgi:glutamate-ammonia-ligase adenylyltransferase